MNWMSILQALLTAVIVATVPLVAKYVIQYLATVRDSLKEKTKEETVDKYIDTAYRIIEQAVMCTTQTYVETLKKQGIFDTEAQKEAFRKSKDTILSLLTEECKTALRNVYGDLDLFLDSRIEQEILASK